MCRLFELLGVEHFGASGSVEAAAFLTRVFKSVRGDFELVGFSGLMLTCLEDVGMAAAAKSMAPNTSIRGGGANPHTNTRIPSPRRSPSGPYVTRSTGAWGAASGSVSAANEGPNMAPSMTTSSPPAVS